MQPKLATQSAIAEAKERTDRKVAMAIRLERWR
jgi:hypothetical protein